MVASSNMSSGNGLLPPMKKPSVPAAAKDPFAFELDEAEPKTSRSKTATPAAAMATPKPPTKGSGKAKQPGWVEPAVRSAKTFGRKSTPKPSGNMRGKDVHSAPDLDDVFDFAPAEAPLPRGATG